MYQRNIKLVKPLTVSLDIGTYNLIEEYSIRNRLSKAWFVRQALKKFFEEMECENKEEHHEKDGYIKW